MVYVCVKEYTIKELINLLLTPEIQRIVDDAHVQSLADAQIYDLREHGQFTMLQSLTIGKALWEPRQNYYIIDGQHRLAAFKILSALYSEILDQKINVVEYNLPTQQAFEDLFVKVSKSLPVHPLIQSSEWCVIKPYMQYLKNNFGNYLSKSERPQKPNISATKLEDRLYNYNYGGQLVCAGATAEQLCMVTGIFNDYIRQQMSNSKLLERDYHTFMAKSKGTTPAWFGIFRNFEWLDVCVRALLEVSPLTKTALEAYFYTIRLPDKNMRPMINHVLRRQVWNKCNPGGMMVGKCYCCGETLDINAMECGHIKAFILGGATHIDNLMPVCKKCNREMGVMDLETYKTTFNFLGKK